MGGTLKIDDLSKLKIINADLCFRLAEKEEIIHKMILAETIKELDPTGKLERIQKEIADIQDSKNIIFAKYQEILSSVSQEMKIDIKDYAINNETGDLMKIF